MTATDTITRWAIEYDECVSCGRTKHPHAAHGLCKVCDARVRRQRKRASTAREDPVTTPPVDSQTPEELFSQPADDLGEERRPGLHTSPVSDGVAPPPSPPSSSIKDRVRAAFGGTKKDEPRGDAPQTKEQKPSKPSGKRVSGAELISDGWGALGAMALRSRRYYPLGNCLAWQAPFAGEMIDEAAKGSVVDRKVIQPVVKARARFDLLAVVGGPPVIVLMIIQDPSKARILLPVLRQSIDGALPYMVPAMKRAEKKWADKLSAMKELYPDLEIPEGVDPVDLIIDRMFAGFDLGLYDQEAPAQEEGVTP